MVSRIKQSFFTAFIIAFIFGCANINQNKKSVNRKDEPLVFIHGIKGGILKDKISAEVNWLTLPQSLNLSSPDIKRSLEWTDNDLPIQKDDNLITSGVLDKITLIPGIIEVKIYHELLTQAPQQYNNFYPFSYDWRKSNFDSLDKYLIFLRKIVEKHKRPVKVIAHSMGGLLTMAAMQREPELFDSVFFIGVPFAGGVGFLKDLQINLSTGLNKQILSPEVLATMPSVYSLFPIQATNELADKDKSIIPINFFNPDDWQKLKIGPFAYSFSDNEKFKKHFSHSLLVSKLFRQELTKGKLLSEGKVRGKQPKVYVVLTKSIPTMVQVIRKDKNQWDFELAPKELGDGRVAAKDAYPPKGLEFTEFESKVIHEDLLNDQKVLNWIFSQE